MGGGGGTYFSPPSPTKKNCERPIKPPPIKFNFKNRNFLIAFLVYSICPLVNYICEGFYRVFLLYKQTPRRRGGKSISFPVTEEIMQLQKNVIRFGFLDGCQHSRWRKRGSSCLKTEEEPHKLIV